MCMDVDIFPALRWVYKTKKWVQTSVRGYKALGGRDAVLISSSILGGGRGPVGQDEEGSGRGGGWTEGRRQGGMTGGAASSALGQQLPWLKPRAIHAGTHWALGLC